MSAETTATPRPGPASQDHDRPDGSPGDDELAAPLDSLLVDAVFSPVRRFNPGMSGLRLGARLLVHPRAVGRRARSTARELGKVAAGLSAVAPSPKDRRFTDVGLVGQPGAEATAAGLPRRGRGDARPRR